MNRLASVIANNRIVQFVWLAA